MNNRTQTAWIVEVMKETQGKSMFKKELKNSLLLIRMRLSLDFCNIVHSSLIILDACNAAFLVFPSKLSLGTR